MLERTMGIEPTLLAWEAKVLPLNYARTFLLNSGQALKIFKTSFNITFFKPK